MFDKRERCCVQTNGEICGKVSTPSERDSVTNPVEKNFELFQIRSISKESIIDIYVRPVTVAAKIEFCTEQNLELIILEIFLVSAAKPQLPLQIEDASRPEHSDVNVMILVASYSILNKRPFPGC